MKNIKDYNLDELQEELINMGEKKFRAEQIFKWIYKEKVKSFDEMTNLSIELREKLKENYTIIIVTHNMQQATRVADSTAFFLLGEVIETGDTEQIFSMPKNKKTEDYITGRFG